MRRKEKAFVATFLVQIALQGAKKFPQSSGKVKHCGNKLPKEASQHESHSFHRFLTTENFSRIMHIYFWSKSRCWEGGDGHYIIEAAFRQTRLFLCFRVFPCYLVPTEQSKEIKSNKSDGKKHVCISFLWLYYVFTTHFSPPPFSNLIQFVQSIILIHQCGVM